MRFSCIKSSTLRSRHSYSTVQKSLLSSYICSSCKEVEAKEAEFGVHLPQANSLERADEQANEMRIKQKFVLGALFNFILLYSIVVTLVLWSQNNDSSQTRVVSKAAFMASFPQHQYDDTRCALLFFGLPRSYESMVLPSIIKNVLIPNSKYGCDVYAHAGIREQEEAGRSGTGGSIDPKAIFLLEQQVKDVAKVASKRTGIHREPNVAIITDTEADFWRMYNETIHKYHTTVDADGNLLYSPWKKSSYTFPTTMDNVVRQWHSLNSVWNLMESESRRMNVQYNRVAMLRSDVLYVTPIDIYQISNARYDTRNQNAIIPGFGMYPVNDRMIYGPYSAVKIWATERFSRIDSHVRKVEPGIGMHSEQFLYDSILPAIQENGTKVLINGDICFFRVRSDGSVRTFDCQMKSINKGIGRLNTKRLVELIVERPCVPWEEKCEGQRCVICPEK